MKIDSCTKFTTRYFATNIYNKNYGNHNFGDSWLKKKTGWLAGWLAGWLRDLKGNHKKS